MSTPMYFRWFVVGLVLQTCGSSCGETPEPVVTPPFSGQNVPYLKVAEGELTVRVRVSRPELSIDCSASSFPLAVDDRVFLPWRNMRLDSEPAPLFRLEDRGKEAEQKCTLLAFDVPSGLVIRTSTGFQDFTVVKESTGKLSVIGATELTRPTEKSPLCAAQKPLSWADATLTGNAVVKASEPTPDGCQTLKLSPTDAAEGAVFTWSACVGSAKLPFVAGDPVRITNNENQMSRARALRIERTRGDRLVTWLLRGAPTGFATVGWDQNLATVSANMRGDDCRAEVSARCATVEQGQDVTFTVSPRSLALHAGESANLTHTNGTKLELFVVHSVLRPVVDPACSRDLGAGVADVGLVVIERGGPTDKTPQIAQ